MTTTLSGKMPTQCHENPQTRGGAADRVVTDPCPPESQAGTTLMALNGSLDDYSPAGALRVLSSSGRTGAVRFAGKGGCTVYLCDGQLYFARGEETDDALATALVRPGRISAEDWTAAVEAAGDSPRVGELLISQGAIDADLLASVVLSVIYDPLITLFRDGDGQFDFEPDTLHWIGPYRGFNVEAIVNEVRRRVRNVDEMQDVIPSTQTWVTACRTLPDGAAQVTLLREDWELVTSLSGPRTVRELAASMGRGEYSTAQVVHRLVRAGLLEVDAGPFLALEDEPGHEPSAAARLAAAETDPDGAGNPFEHAPVDPVDDLGVTFGPRLDDAGTGPEMPVEAEDMLPRRAAHPVDTADIWEDPLVSGDTVPSDELGLAGDLGPALAGIAGFHDPMAALRDEDPALAEATDASLVDPNAAWLENLYAQFIDDTDEPGKKQALDVAFQTSEPLEAERTGTLRRLVDALRRI